jgi:hypothetical protein
MRPAGEGDARAGPDDLHVTEIFAGTEKGAVELNRAILAIEMRNDFEPGAGTMTELLTEARGSAKPLKSGPHGFTLRFWCWRNT